MHPPIGSKRPMEPTAKELLERIPTESAALLERMPALL
jgi:hypothetical protein